MARRRKICAALVDELDIGHAVTFLGALKTDEVLDLMRHSNAFVLASRVETFGVVFIEALSTRLAGHCDNVRRTSVDS